MAAGSTPIRINTSSCRGSLFIHATPSWFYKYCIIQVSIAYWFHIFKYIPQVLNNIVLKNWAVYETRLFICNVLAGFRVNHALQTSELRNFDMLIHFVDSISHLSKNSIYNSSISMHTTTSQWQTGSVVPHTKAISPILGWQSRTDRLFIAE